LLKATAAKAVKPEVVAVEPEVAAVVADLHAVMADVPVVGEGCLGLGSNSGEKQGYCE
jgi:hypothetical protein